MERRYTEQGVLNYFNKTMKGMIFEKWKVYDRNNRKLIRKNNFDENFPFALCDLVKKMASEYLANIEDNKVLYRLNSGYDSEEYNHYIY